jgi:hypothetical protein
MAAAFTSWTAYAIGRSRKLVKKIAADAHRRARHLGACFRGWRALVAARLATAAALHRAVAHWRSAQIVGAFSAWRGNARIAASHREIGESESL